MLLEFLKIFWTYVCANAESFICLTLAANFGLLGFVPKGKHCRALMILYRLIAISAIIVLMFVPLEINWMAWLFGKTLFAILFSNLLVLLIVFIVFWLWWILVGFIFTKSAGGIADTLRG